MSDADPGAGVLRRHFVAIATGKYNDPAFEPLSVGEEVRAVQAWLLDHDRLGERSFHTAFPDLANDPDEDAIRAAFRRPERPWNTRDAAVVFITGHGQIANGHHWLVLRDSEAGELHRTALRTSDLVGWLQGPDGIEHLLLIVDACFAGAIVRDTVRFDDQFPPSWLILPSASRNGTAQVGALTTAMTRAIAKLRGGQGAKWGTHRPYFQVSDFLDTVREFLPGQDLDPLYRGQFGAEHVCLPNPHYSPPDTVPTGSGRHELALPKDDLAIHWAPRARGIAGPESAQTSGGWLFTGRAGLVRTLIRLIDPLPPGVDGDAGGVTLVSGGAGCGKSAVLARLVTLSDPEFLRTYAEQLADVPADLCPAEGAVDVAVLATGKYPHEVLAQILAVITHQHDLGHDGAPGGSDIDALVDACRDQIARRWRMRWPTTVVLDALDESEQPERIAHALRRLTDQPGLRLLIGVRSPAGPDDPLATSGPAGPLADHVEHLLGARRLRVDEDPWWSQHDITHYAASILLHTPDSPYTGRDEHAHQLARAISDRVGRSFLVARLAATALTQRDADDLVEPTDPDWLATLDEGVVGVFRADLERLFPDPDRRLATVELLRAVAFAFGRGLPWGDVWPLVANAVADRRAKYGDRDIADLLASPISAYLITDREDDTTVYRLFHDALRHTLRERWRELLTP